MAIIYKQNHNLSIDDFLKLTDLELAYFYGEGIKEQKIKRNVTFLLKRSVQT